MTQKKEILKYLQTHKCGITSKDAWDMFGVSRLASIICTLKKEGYRIDSKLVKVPCRKRYAWVSRYTMGV